MLPSSCVTGVALTACQKPGEVNRDHKMPALHVKLQIWDLQLGDEKSARLAGKVTEDKGTLRKRVFPPNFGFD